MAAGVLAGAVALAIPGAGAMAQTQEPEEESGIQFAPDDPEDSPSPTTTRKMPAPGAPARKTPNSNSGGGGGGSAGEQVEPPTRSRTAIEHGDAGTKKAASGTAKSSDDEDEYGDHRGARDHRESGIFGSYRVRLMYARPNFNDGLKFYNFMYGTPKGYPEIAADWFFPTNWYATFGLSFRFGYYTADGHAAQDTKSSTATASSVQQSDLAIDPNGPTSLTLVPLQALLATEFTPFHRKWVVIDGWAGIERLYYQETRNAPTTTTTAATATTSSSSSSCTTSAGTTTTNADGTTSTVAGTTTCVPVDTTKTNTGWVNSIVVGVAANILLNPIDEESARSMRGSMGLGSIYFSPYMEWIKGMGHPHPSFGRTVYGLAFTFETLN